jgi:hypothetical protein
MFVTTIKRLAPLVALHVALLTGADPCARAAELIMFERTGCPYCAAFDREVAPIYPLTEEGKTIPIRRLDVTKPVPPDLNFIRVERLAPVFVLVDSGREIGRIRGYAGENHFWGLFGVLVERLRRQGAASGLALSARLAARLER